ncbi:MAG: hypothetical protein A2X86_07975 [Bdellovibrionales bacterium GWA2_49_15]|nr:MAG: hypothetical protein A2X86_07975 [Bdellovibrionales bacterium GWA2_49_15]HAZ11784.1 hypothetical protein [Bdellovibrionales bacterium]
MTTENAESKSQKVQVKTVLESWNKVKQELHNFVKEKKIKEIQSSVKAFVRNAKKDFNGLVGKDLVDIKKKFNDEKKQLETLVDKVIQAEVKKARHFVDIQKNELSKLQKKVEGFVRIKKPAKKTTRRTTAKTTGRKTTRKSAT